ncbi:MAG: hypothetical protein ABJB66_12795 [Gemmatimonadaceae bacterium]
MSGRMTNTGRTFTSIPHAKNSGICSSFKALILAMPKRRAAVLMKAASLIAIAALSLPQAMFAQPTTVSLLDYTATVPKTWTSRPPASKMRLAEFVAGAAGGAEVIVYSFGPGQGGTVDANLERWKSQFSNPDGKPVSDKITQGKVGAFPMTIAEYQGTYARGIGAGSAPQDALPNHILIAVIIETPKGSLIFQMFGPKAAAEAQREAYLSFVRSLK